MAEFSEAWLQKQGLSLPSKTLGQLSDTLEAVLEMRVGYALASRLSDAQISEFEKLFDSTDDNDIDNKRINWLEKNYPRYNRVVRYQKAKLSKQVRKSTDIAAFIKYLAKTEISST